MREERGRGGGEGSLLREEVSSYCHPGERTKRGRGGGRSSPHLLSLPSCFEETAERARPHVRGASTIPPPREEWATATRVEEEGEEERGGGGGGETRAAAAAVFASAGASLLSSLPIPVGASGAVSAAEVGAACAGLVSCVVMGGLRSSSFGRFSSKRKERVKRERRHSDASLRFPSLYSLR